MLKKRLIEFFKKLFKRKVHSCATCTHWNNFDLEGCDTFIADTGEVLHFYKNANKKCTKYREKLKLTTPRIEGDTIERCPHVESGETKAVASVIISPTRVKDVCSECYKSHKSSIIYQPTRTMLISKRKPPKPSSKFFKPEPAHAKRLRKKGAKLEDEQD